MAPLTCRVLPHEAGDGPANMARDEALLDLVAAEPGSAAFRTYGWTEPTLSLGYFQAIAEAEADPRWRGVPVVRRPTGGGAIWHDREVTYALASPAPTRSRAGAASSTGRSTRRSPASSRGFGVDAAPAGRGRRRRGPAPRPFLCFADRDAEDLVVGAVEARRQRPAAAGGGGPPARVAPARPVRRGPPSCPGPPTSRRSPVDADVLVGTVAASRCPRRWGWSPAPDDWPEPVARHAPRTWNGRSIAIPAWTRRR